MVRVLATSFALCVQSCLATAASKPHIVFVMADDLGSNDVGWHDPSVLSPEIDDLATNGIKLSSMYTYSWCAPSRGAFMSGRYAPKSGFEGCGGPSSNGKGAVTVFPLEYKFLPAMLKQAGYRTVMAGKWHLGFARQVDLPENRGFDKWIGYLEGGEDYYTRRTKIKASNCSTDYDFWFGVPGNGGPVAKGDYYTSEYSTKVYSDFLVKQIEAHDPSEPLFIYAAFQGVHYPLEVPKEYFDRYAAQGAGSGDCTWDKQVLSNGFPNGFQCEATPAFPNLGHVGLDCLCNRLVVKAQVSALSEGVGNLTRALAAKGMWNNTVLIFMGDNGGPSDGGHSNAPLRGGKLNFFEGGIRPAAFITSPLLPESVRGSTFDALAHETDWYATFARLAGVTPPRGIDGVDLWDALVTASPHRDEVLVADHVLRQGRWKLVAGAGRGLGAMAWRTGMLKGCMLGTNGGWLSPPTNATNQCPLDIYSKNGNTKQLGCPDDDRTEFHVTSDVDRWLCSTPCTPETPCLWDVEADPREEHEVSGKHPDVVAKLVARLQELQQDFRGPSTVQDNGAFCSAVESRRVAGRGLFAGPWIDDDVPEISSSWQIVFV